ncbi:MAG: transketolase [Magnetococcus sp. YQC-9]
MNQAPLSAEEMRQKATWVRAETLLLHQRAPGIRIASSLSPVEFLVALYYSSPLRHDPARPDWSERDRLIMSKGHGVISIYPILADLGYFPLEELEKIATEASFLGVIPDASIPGIETTNGALGHGLGVATGMALALRQMGNDAQLCVVCGDGEMNEGSVWESIMLASRHRLGNLLLVVDDNRISMLGFQDQILDLAPLEEKLSIFGWEAERVDGHDPLAIAGRLQALWRAGGDRPRALILDTIKGKGVASLENQPLSHVMSLSPAEVDAAIARCPAGAGA